MRLAGDGGWRMAGLGLMEAESNMDSLLLSVTEEEED